MRLIILSLLMSFFAANCTNKGDSPKSKQMYDEVMQVHDEVMPKMKDIRQFSKKLESIENYQANDDVVEAIEDLKDAKESMMVWMAQFKIPKGLGAEEEIAFLESQKVSVKTMSELIHSSLEQAEKVLSEVE